MYAAYQSHQSCSGATCSYESCRSAVSCNRPASEATSISVLPFPPGQPGRDLLEEPAVAVGIAERGVALVGAALRVQARAGSVGAEVEEVTDLYAAADEVIPRRLDVRDDQLQALGGAGLGLGQAASERDGALRVGGRQLHHAATFAEVEVGVHAPSKALVEALCPIDIGDGQSHDLELHVDGSRRGALG